MVILVNKKDIRTGTMPKMEAHKKKDCATVPFQYLYSTQKGNYYCNRERLINITRVVYGPIPVVAIPNLMKE